LYVETVLICKLSYDILDHPAKTYFTLKIFSEPTEREEGFLLYRNEQFTVSLRSTRNDIQPSKEIFASPRKTAH